MYKILGFDSYYEYLGSKHWQALKQCYWVSGLPWECRICLVSKRLELHHRSYKNLGRETPGKDVILLCHFCHFQVHHYDDGSRVYLEYKYLVAREEELYLRERSLLTRFLRFRPGTFINHLFGYD